MPEKQGVLPQVLLRLQLIAFISVGILASADESFGPTTSGGQKMSRQIILGQR